MNREVVVFQNKESLAKALAQHIAKKIVQNRNKELHIALSGGSTPALLFDELALMEISWNFVHLWWGDERCVLPTDEQSNYRMTKKHLLDRIAIPEENIHRVMGELLPAEACATYVDELQKAFKGALPVFSLIILGMGDDGHTASLFPHELSLFTSPAWCVEATHPNGSSRISFTGKIINAAQEVVFLISGESKAQRVEEVLTLKRNYKDLPSSYVNPEQGSLLFFLDADAARLL